jgi:hypothetical protein
MANRHRAPGRRRRQLVLPGLPPSTAATPPLRAKRDWNEAEFRRALARNGMRLTNGGLTLVDDAGRVFAPILRRDPIRVARRATLARILRQRAEDKKNVDAPRRD